jgi:hypothetical protein
MRALMNKLLALALGVASWAASAAGAGTVSHIYLYQTFNTSVVSAFDLSNNFQLLGTYRGSANTLSASGDYVYWTQGVALYRAKPDLSDAQVYSYLGFAPTELAVDASAGVIYADVPGVGLATLNLANPSQILMFRNGPVSQITAGAGHVFFQEGSRVWQASPSLNDATPYFDLTGPSTDIAYRPADDMLFVALDTLVLGLGTRGGGPVQVTAATNTNVHVDHVAAAGNFKLVQTGHNLSFNEGAFFTGMSYFGNFGLTPSNLAMLEVQVASVPEPTALLLMPLGLAVLAFKFPRRRAARA